MGFFNDIGKFFGGIATAVVPGFGTLAKTGMFGDDLAALSGAPQAGPAVAAIVASPNLLASELAPRVPPIRVAAPAPRPFGVPGLSGRTVNVPVEFLQALREAARQATASPAFIPAGTFIPPQAVTALEMNQAITPLAAVAAAVPTTPALSFSEQFVRRLLPGVERPPVPTTPALSFSEQFVRRLLPGVQR